MDLSIQREEEGFGNGSNHLKAESLIACQVKLFWNSPEQTSAAPTLICSQLISSPGLGLATNQKSLNLYLQSAKLSWSSSAHLKGDSLLRKKI